MLDTAGQIMPAVTDHHNTSYFRLTVELNDPIDRAQLQRALDQLAPRWSRFFVSLTTKWSGWTLQPLPHPPRVEDDGVPCKGADIHVPGTPLVRFRVHGAILGLEVSHVMTDGFGALALLKAVLAEYQGASHPAEGGTETATDAYQQHYRAGLPWPEPTPPAWRIPGERIPGSEYRSQAFRLPAQAVLERARSLGLSLTEYLASLHLSVLQEYRTSLSLGVPSADHRPLTVMIPADLRRVFASGSLANFSGVLLPTLTWSEPSLSFEQIAGEVRCQLRHQRTPDQLARQITRNVWGTNFLLFRLLPRGLLTPLLRVFYRVFGEGGITSHLSNLGPVEFPPPVAAGVRSLAFLPGASTQTGTNIGVVSYQGQLVLCFGSVLARSEIESSFVQKLKGEGFVVVPV